MITNQLARRPRERGCQEIAGTDKFVVPAQVGTQGQVTEIPRFPLSRERRGKGARVECAELDYSLESGVPRAGAL